MKAVFVALACLVVSPVWAVNKCTIDGKLVFQDAPCPGKGETLVVKPASGTAPRAATPVPTTDGAPPAAAPMTEAQRIEKQVAASQTERRRQALEVQLVPNADAAVVKHRAECDLAIKELQNRKRMANNNLAGATWEGSISSEMTAIATRCDTRGRELKDDATSLRTECQKLGGCAR